MPPAGEARSRRPPPSQTGCGNTEKTLWRQRRPHRLYTRPEATLVGWHSAVCMRHSQCGDVHLVHDGERRRPECDIRSNATADCRGRRYSRQCRKSHRRPRGRIHDGRHFRHRFLRSGILCFHAWSCMFRKSAAALLEPIVPLHLSCRGRVDNHRSAHDKPCRHFSIRW